MNGRGEFCQDALELTWLALLNVQRKAARRPNGEIATDAAQIGALALVSIATDLRHIREAMVDPVADLEPEPHAPAVPCMVCRRPAGHGHKLDCPNR